MSKLINAIKAHQTGDRFAIQEATSLVPSLSVDETWRTAPTGKTYRIEAIIGTKVDIYDPETYSSNIDIVDQTVRSVRYSIAEEVFGEFRKPLLTLRTNFIRRGDIESAAIVEDIMDSMFKV